MRVLVVEDEARMAAHVANALAEESWAVDVAHDGARALELVDSCDYDAIVLDLMLPKVDGLTMCRRLRSRGKLTPVLMLSARDMIEDRVRGLDAGGDDYLVKPFAIEELTARLRALVRRHQRRAAPVLQVGDLVLDLGTRTVRRNGREIPLTAREYSLLEYLMQQPGIVHTRTMIAEHVWDFSLDYASNVVDVYIKHLRDKIDDKQDGAGSFVQAVRGVGYVLRDPDASHAQ
jgi:DNA-binding response OmpR family regulator